MESRTDAESECSSYGLSENDADIDSMEEGDFNQKTFYNCRQQQTQERVDGSLLTEKQHSYALQLTSNCKHPNYEKLEQVVSTEGVLIRNVFGDKYSLYDVVVDQLRRFGDTSWTSLELEHAVMDFIAEKYHVQRSDNLLMMLQANGLVSQDGNGPNTDYIMLLVLSIILKREIRVYLTKGPANVIGAKYRGLPLLLGKLSDSQYVSLWIVEQKNNSTEELNEKFERSCRISPGDSSDSTYHDGLQRENVKKRSKKKTKTHLEQQCKTAVLDQHLQIARFVRTPERCKLTGALAKTDGEAVYQDVWVNLEKVHSEKGSGALIPFLDAQFKTLRGSDDDFAIVTLILGYRAAAYLEDDDHRWHKQLKQLARSLETYNFTHTNMVHAWLGYMFYDFYRGKGKLGKAFSHVQNALRHIQTEAPSPWTANVYEIQADMYDILAQVTPKLKKQYRKEAVTCYRLALEHYMFEQQSASLEVVYCALQIVNVTLDMPTMDTINTFSNIHIVLQHGRQCSLSESDISEAERVLCSVKQQVEEMDTPYEHNEYISICEIFANIRRAQFHISFKKYNLSHSALLKANEKYSDWDNIYNVRPRSWHHKISYLQADLKTLLEEISEQIDLALRVKVVSATSLTKEGTQGYLVMHPELEDPILVPILDEDTPLSSLTTDSHFTGVSDGLQESYSSLEE